MTPSLIFLTALLATLSQAHFVLQSPLPLGIFNDVIESTGPCDGYSISSRNNVTNYAVGGYPVHLLSTHTKVTWIFRAALINDTSAWVEVVPPVSQTSIGDFCLPSVPGYTPWVGLDSVLQVVQFAPDGILYQCAAVIFVAGGPANVPGECKNSSGIVASFVPFTSTVPEPAGATLISTASAGVESNSTATTSGAGASKTSTAATSSKTSWGRSYRYGSSLANVGFVIAVAVLGICLL